MKDIFYYHYNLSPPFILIEYAVENSIDKHIFMKRDNLEGSSFYYLGKATPEQHTVKQDRMLDKSGKKIPIVHMNMIMERPVQHDLYHYLVEGKADMSN